MRVLTLSWEYPPLVVGGLGRHVEAVSRELAAQGHQVRVVTRGDSPVAATESRDGVRVSRAALDPLAIDFTTESLLAWSQAAEHALLRVALPLVRRWRPDVIHAHDWLVAQTAITLKAQTGVPLVATLHATEAGRHHGWLPRPLNLAIHSVEQWLGSQADAVITCSTTMRNEVLQLFELAPEVVRVIPNGIDAVRWRATKQATAARRAAHAGDGPLVVYAGRLVHEKGVQTLVHALRSLRETYHGLRLVVAGAGVHEPTLRALARRLRVAKSIDWLGFVSEDELPALFGAADVVVVPSLYEPFGIVALEAAVAGAPLVVAQTGGLRDLAEVGVAGESFPAGDVHALTVAIHTILDDPLRTRRMARRAARIVRRNYTWHTVAAQTAGVYAEVVRARGGP